MYEFWSDSLLMFPQPFSSCFVSRAFETAALCVFSNMESLKLWIALEPKQLEELNKGNEVFPDAYSGRFGLRLGPAEAVNRAQYFMDWTPDGLKGEYHQKDYAVMEMEISALGYLQKVEGGILEKTKPTEYRWHGPVKHEERDGQGRMLYRISEMAVKFI